MAGPFLIARGEVQPQIPTNALLSVTRVIVDSAVNGRIEMTAGGSPSESTDIPAGNTVLERRFGGVFLAIKNLGAQTITVRTE